MADDAQPSAEQTPQKRETLRVQLPPRPLKPDSTQLSRANAGTAATIPMKSSDQIKPGAPAGTGTVTPPWSTAVTQPMQKPGRPPTGLVGPAPSQLTQSSSLTGSRAKTEPLVLPTPASPRPSAPPTLPGSKTASIRPVFSSTGAAPALTGIVPGRPAPETAPAPATPPGLPPVATGRVPTASGRVPVAPPRVIIANPQAKVFVSGKTDQLSEVAPIEFRTRPPALPVTGTLPAITKDTVGMPQKSTSGLADTAPTTIPPLPATSPSAPAARVPEPLAPQPPLVASAPLPVQPPPLAKVAPPMEVTPSGSPNIPLPVAKSAPILAPSIKPPPLAFTARPSSQAATVPITPSAPPPLAPTIPMARPEPPAPVLPPPVPSENWAPRQTTSTVPPVIPPMTPSPTASLPLTPSKTSAISSSDAGLKQSAQIVSPVEPLARKKSGPLPPSAIKPSVAPVVDPSKKSGSITAISDPAKKSSMIIPPVEPILRKSARLFQPPLPSASSRVQTQSLIAPPPPLVVSSPSAPPTPQPVPVTASSPAPFVPPPAPATPPEPPAIPVVRAPSAVQPIPVPASPVSPTKRSSRIILANALEREATPFPKTPPPMTVVPPVSASQRLAPATIVAGTAAAVGAILAAESTLKPADPTLMDESQIPSTPPPPPITPRSSGVIAPPPVKPLTARLDTPPPAPVVPAANTIVPPRRSQTQSVTPPPAVPPRTGPPATPPPAIKPVVPMSATGAPPAVRPVLPGAAVPIAPKPVLPTGTPPGVAPLPTSGVKPVLPGAVTPIKPVIPGTVAPVAPLPVTPPAPGAPLRPAATVPAPVSRSDGKTGTAAVKTPPPKETARITVKPSLPGAIAPIAAGALAAGAVKPAVAVPAGAVAAKPAAVPVAGIPAYEEEPSTTLTTSLAAILMVLTWSTAVALFLSYRHII